MKTKLDLDATITKRLMYRKIKSSILRLSSSIITAFLVLFLIIILSSISKMAYVKLFKTKILIEIDVNKFNNLDIRGKKKMLVEDLKNGFYIFLKKHNKFELMQNLSDRDIKPSDYMRYNFLFSNNSIIDISKKIELSEKNPSKIKIWVDVNSKIDHRFKINNYGFYNDLIKYLKTNQLIKKKFDLSFFKNTDSRNSSSAGVISALTSSFWIMVVLLPISFIIATLTAIYLEEFASKNKFNSFLELNINNLAAIPSIIFGLIGLLVYIHFIHLPRSSSIVAGLTLSMLVLPIMIVSTRASIKSVPQSVRDAAIAMGAGKVRVVFGIVIPSSLAGILTGIMLGISRAIGETAPLLIIGMSAFIPSVPKNVMDPAVSMPNQIYLWSSMPQVAFIENASLGIITLLIILFTINIITNIIRDKYEVRW